MSKGYSIDTATHTLVFTRIIACTPERLYDAWTTEAEISKWWDPSGKPLAECVIDLRVGGRMKLVNQGHEQFPFVGTYTELRRPVRIAFDAMGAAGSVDLVAAGEATEMTIRIRCASAEQLEQFSKMEIAEGTAQTADNLVAYLS